MKLRILHLILILTCSLTAFAGGPGGGGCSVPFSPCWCLSHPNEQPCINQGVPINGELWILLAAGLIIGVYYIKKTKSQKANLKS